MTPQEIYAEARPQLPRGVRLREDKLRNRWVLLAPERLLTLNDSALLIVRRCDGDATVASIVNDLSREFAADPARVDNDVRVLLASLHEKLMVRL